MIADPRVEGFALAALQTLTDEEFERVIAAEIERWGRPATRQSQRVRRSPGWWRWVQFPDS